MNEIMQVIFWIVASLITALAFVLWNKLKSVEDKAEKNESELAKFKTHVAETYANKKDIEEMERRINEQLTNLGKRFEDGFNMIYQQLLNKD